MYKLQKKSCCKCQSKKNTSRNFLKKFPHSMQHPLTTTIMLIIALLLWWLIYTHLANISDFIVYTLFHIKHGSQLGSSLQFFLYDTPKVLMLLILVIYFVGLLRSYITPVKTRKILAGKHEFTGNILASTLGIITPFCSCSAIPLFIGFVTAGIPLGVTFSFLVAAPMVNEVALILLYGLLGWKIAAIYLTTGLLIAISAGFIIGKLRMEKYIADWVRELDKSSTNEQEEKIAWNNRLIVAWYSVIDIIKRVWLFMLIGIAIGAGIHGYVPQNFMAAIMGKSAWWSVPAAVLIGVPMYSNAAGIIPIVEALLGKGAALGTVLAFMMSVTALSFPEMIILRKVLKPRLIFAFVSIVTIGILIVGYLFNLLI